MAAAKNTKIKVTKVKIPKIGKPPKAPKFSVKLPKVTTKKIKFQNV